MKKKQYELFVTVGLAHDIEHAYHEQGLKCHADSIIEEYSRVWKCRKKAIHRNTLNESTVFHHRQTDIIKNKDRSTEGRALMID